MKEAAVKTDKQSVHKSTSSLQSVAIQYSVTGIQDTVCSFTQRRLGKLHKYVGGGVYRLPNTEIINKKEVGKHNRRDSQKNTEKSYFVMTKLFLLKSYKNTDKVGEHRWVRKMSVHDTGKEKKTKKNGDY